ncbi:MAG: hypothetical protein ACREFP_07565 [Acetobacteraceae bacterium]
MRERPREIGRTHFLREIIGLAAQRLMVQDVEGLAGAPHGVRCADCLTYRNGYPRRD